MRTIPRGRTRRAARSLPTGGLPMEAPRALVHAILTVVIGGLLLDAAPLPASSAILGTVRGPETARLSLNGGKSWLALGGRSLPVMPGTEIRSAGGNAQLALGDGSRISVMPFSSLKFSGTSHGTEVLLAYGRLAFSLAGRTSVEIVTPTARLEPISGDAIAGEVFVANTGLTGLQMSRGTLNVRALSQPHRIMLASVEPVFLPAPPSMPGVYFSSDTPDAPPLHAKGVFTPDGRSIGYVGRDGSFVIAPGYTRHLTRAFSPKLVRVAMNAIPERDRIEDATPLFDVNGGYVGYLSGPVFYAQAPTAPTLEPGTAGEGTPPGSAAGGKTGLSTAAIAGISAVSAGGIGLGAAAAGGAFGKKKNKGDRDDHHDNTRDDRCPSGTPPATPTQPSGCGS